MARSARAMTSGAAGHVVLHALHAIGRLIEMPPLSRSCSPSARTGERAHRRARTAPPASAAARRSPGHAEEQTHAELVELMLVENLDGDVRKRQQRLATCDEVALQPIAWFVDEHPRGIGGFADARAALDRGLRLCPPAISSCETKNRSSCEFL